MSDEEELELQALQRQLDDAFQVTRPRPDFEDELWLRMQAHRPMWQRLRDGLGALIDGIREAPGVPATAVAILLVVFLGAGIVKYGGLLPGAGTASLAPAGQDTGTKGGAEAPREFGDSLPVPALSGGSTAPIDHAVTSPGYYSGSATLVWTGTFDLTPSNLPVYRYREPTAQDAEQFAAALGAAPAAQQTPGSLGTYSGANFELVVTGSVAHPAKEPSFKLSELSARTAAGSDPVRVATSYLAARSLIPAWSYQTEVARAGNITRVWFVRLFDTNQGQVPLVDGHGARYGIEVEIKSGQPRVVETGPLPLAIDSATYPVISSDQAIRAVLATSAAPSGGIPVVKLTKAELVYVLAWAGDHSFYEPAYLFSGTFTDQGVTKVKLVLVPAVGPSSLSP
jgi:hypothetical protein